MHVYAKLIIFAIVINILILVFFLEPIELFDIKPGHYLVDYDVGNIVKSKTGQIYEKKKLAVIVPYRNSLKELLYFVPHMCRYLNYQKIPFHIYIIHQTDQLRFNRGALINIGYNYTRDKFDYSVHQDVDLLPLNPKLSYEFPHDGVFHVADIFYHPTVIDIASFNKF
jgi:N-terminal region of glycosyl transferase group 7